MVRQDSEFQDLLKQFVCVRLVKMNGVDLDQFQFDYDMTWAAFFMNADGTIYGRYGTRSEKGAMAFNSVASLKNAMRRALELHHQYPTNRQALAAKHGPKPKYRTAAQIPALRKQFGQRLFQPVGKRNCIHCHNIYNGLDETAYQQGTFSLESLWKYPLPDNVGMEIDVDSGNRVTRVKPGSFADKAGIRPGDVVQKMNGQPIISIADMQWVLHHLPNEALLDVEVDRGGRAVPCALALGGDWKKSDISWRASMWNIRPRLRGAWLVPVDDAQRKLLRIPADKLALKVRRIFNQALNKAGLRQGDILIAADGVSRAMTPPQFQAWMKLSHQGAKELPVTVRRGDRTIDLRLPLE